MTYSDLLSNLDGAKTQGGGHIARCPAHDDRQASLGIKEGDDGRILLHCHAGCEPESICAALGLSLADLFAESKPVNGKPKREIVASYDYLDESGKLLFQAVRYSPKDFHQRRPDGASGWVWKLDGVRRVLYRLPELLAADPAATVFVAEGEKDVDRLRLLGLVATCNSGGAGKWRDDYSEFLRGREVVILPDNDDAGRAHAAHVALALQGVAASVKVLALTGLPEKGDVSDWLNAGGDAERLCVLADGAQVWTANTKGKANPDTADEKNEGRPAQFANSANSAQGEWEPPARFNEYTLPTFPIHCLPDWLRAFAVELARETQTPNDMAAIQGLANCAAAVAGKFLIEARKGWVEPTNLYTVCVLPVGNRKTAVHDAATAPLAEFERELVKEMQPIIDEKRLEKETLEERIKHLKTIAAKCDDAHERSTKLAELKTLADELRGLKVPAIPKLIVSGDITPETIGSHLAEQDGRLFLSSDEGELFELLSGRYSSGTPNFEVILKAHTGATIRVDRRTRSEIVERATLTIALTVQPDVLRGLVTKPQFRGRGLLGRLLYSLPVSTVGRRLCDAEPMSAETASAYGRKIRTMAAVMRPDDGPYKVVLSADARTAIQAFMRDVEPQLPEDAPMGSLADWGTKLSGAVVRIAGILHLAKKSGRLEAMRCEIAAETLDEAAEIGRYFQAHALAAYAEMGNDPEIEDAKYVLRHLQKAGTTDVTKREIFELTKSRFKKVERLEPALKLLEIHNYIRPLARASEPGKPGRKASQLFEINPHTPTAYNSHNSHNLAIDDANRAEMGDSANCANCTPETYFAGALDTKPVFDNLPPWDSEPEPLEQPLDVPPAPPIPAMPKPANRRASV